MHPRRASKKKTTKKRKQKKYLVCGGLDYSVRLVTGDKDRDEVVEELLLDGVSEDKIEIYVVSKVLKVKATALTYKEVK